MRGRDAAPPDRHRRFGRFGEVLAVGDRVRRERPGIHNGKRCAAPCTGEIPLPDYAGLVEEARAFLSGRSRAVRHRLAREMSEAAEALEFERAARLRDDIAALKELGQRGDVQRDAQPEVFPIDPKKGLVGLRKVLGLEKTPRTIEGVDIAHLGGSETVASLVQFLDGLPFKPGYRRFRIKSVSGVDDFASIREVVSRRFRRTMRRIPTRGSGSIRPILPSLRYPRPRRSGHRAR